MKIKLVAGLVCSLLIIPGVRADQPKSDRPNILFIAIDDMNDWTGFLGGHPQAITPNMDKLAEKGVNFSNAHCAAPGMFPEPQRVALRYRAF